MSTQTRSSRRLWLVSRGVSRERRSGLDLLPKLHECIYNKRVITLEDQATPLRLEWRRRHQRSNKTLLSPDEEHGCRHIGTQRHAYTHTMLRGVFLAPPGYVPRIFKLFFRIQFKWASRQWQQQVNPRTFLSPRLHSHACDWSTQYKPLIHCRTSSRTYTHTRARCLSLAHTHTCLLHCSTGSWPESRSMKTHKYSLTHASFFVRIAPNRKQSRETIHTDTDTVTDSNRDTHTLKTRLFHCSTTGSRAESRNDEVTDSEGSIVRSEALYESSLFPSSSSVVPVRCVSGG